MATMRAIVTSPTSTEKLQLGAVPFPTQGASETLVRVRCFSLNRGEVRQAMNATDKHRPGWDLAGLVERAAPDGRGPLVGQRVVAFVPSGAWAELVVVPINALAVLPDGMPFASAATLPVAGLTALHAIERASGLLGRKALITGASGGVGLYACQLARLSGARVVGLVHQTSHAEVVEQAGAEQTIATDAADAAAQLGPYRLIVESVGGKMLAGVLGLLDADGVCVSFGASAHHEVTFNLWSLVSPGRASLYGLGLFNELKRESAATGLERLVYLMNAGQLKPFVALEAPWEQIADAARRLLERQFTGKAVLHVT